MGVIITTRTERTIDFGLGTVVFCEESGTVRFSSIEATANPNNVREFVMVLEDVATMMERCGGCNGTAS
jgi:hypothetical protein